MAVRFPDRLVVIFARNQDICVETGSGWFLRVPLSSYFYNVCNDQW